MLRCAAELIDPDVSKEHWHLLASQTTRTPNLNDAETPNPVSGTYTVLTYYVPTSTYKQTDTHTHTHNIHT